MTIRDLVPEIIDSGPMCISDLFQNKSLAYFITQNKILNEITLIFSHL